MNSHNWMYQHPESEIWWWAFPPSALHREAELSAFFWGHVWERHPGSSLVYSALFSHRPFNLSRPTVGELLDNYASSGYSTFVIEDIVRCRCCISSLFCSIVPLQAQWAFTRVRAWFGERSNSCAPLPNYATNLLDNYWHYRRSCS